MGFNCLIVLENESECERFTDRLRAKAEGIMVAQHSHPFVTGIGDGTLDIETIKVWGRQDYLYLIE